MSDVAQGPDWWLASDGKWYPPTSLPVAAPPPPPPAPGSMPPAGTYQHPARPLSGALSAWAQALFWVTFVSYLVVLAVNAAALSAFEDYLEASDFSAFLLLDDWIAADDARVGVTLLSLLVWLAALIVLIVWMNKAHKVTSVLWPGDRKWSSGWTVGGWFIPFANFVIPKLVFNEMDRIATAPRAGGRVDESWRHRSTIGIGWAWWLTMAAAIVLNTVAGSILSDAFAPTRLELDADQIRTGYTMAMLAAVTWCVALACGALYIRSLSKRLAVMYQP